MTSSLPHDGRTAIVTGAGSGIGQATALRLAAEGATVVACDVNAAGLEDTAGRAGETRLTTMVADVTSQDDVDRLVAAAGAGLDIVANVAGIFDVFAPLTETTDELWDRLLAVNLSGPMRLARAALPVMLEHGRGDIVNVASIAGLVGGMGGPAYTSSKHGLVGLTKNIATFYAERGIRANAVCPAGVDTNLQRNAIGGTRESWVMERLGRVSLGRPGRMAAPDEIAALISYLCSDIAVNINGSIIATDGGITAI